MLNRFASVATGSGWFKQARSFSKVAAYVGQQYVKSTGLKYYQVSLTSPSAGLPRVPSIWSSFLPASREGVPLLAANSDLLKNMLGIFGDSTWINSDENKYGLLLANAPVSPSQHRYLVVTPAFSLSNDGFVKYSELTDPQLLLQLASCVPNGAKLYGNIPVETAVLPGTLPLTIDKIWSEKSLDSIIQLGSYNFIRAKLYPRVELNDHVVIPLDAQTLDPYHIFSGGLGWFVVIDKRSKTLRAVFPGAGHSPWSILDIANNHLGAGYWNQNVAVLAAVLNKASKLPLTTPEDIRKAADSWFVGSNTRGNRRTLELFDQLGALIAVNPEAVGWNPIYGDSEPELSSEATFAKQLLKATDRTGSLQAISGLPILRRPPGDQIIQRPASESIEPEPHKLVTKRRKTQRPPEITPKKD